MPSLPSTDPLRSAAGLVARVTAAVIATTGAVVLGAIYVLVSVFSDVKQSELAVITTVLLGIFLVLLGGALTVVGSRGGSSEDGEAKSRGTGGRFVIAAGALLLIASVAITNCPK